VWLCCPPSRRRSTISSRSGSRSSSISGISAGAITAILLNLLLNTEQMREARLSDPSIGASDAVRGPVAAALVHPDAQGTGLIPTQVLSDELAAEQTGRRDAGRRVADSRRGRGPGVAQGHATRGT
jgi:hypothetical protein